MEPLKLSRPGNISEAWWTEVCKKLKNAVVFLDDFVAESLHWSGGLERLIKAGCKDVKEFNVFEVCKKDDEKAVFLLGSIISGAVSDTLRQIIKASHLKYVIIVTGAHSSVHAYSAFGGREGDEKATMERIEQQVLQWLGNMNYTVELFYFPLILVQLTEDSFLLPRFRNLFPLFEDEVADATKQYTGHGKVERKAIQSLEDLEFHHLPFDLRVSIHHFTVSLHSYLQGMSAREEIYSIGHFARIVGGELETYNPARQRRKMAANKVSLVLVDRVLDLVSPADFDSSVLMSRLLSLLPRLPGHAVDSAVDLSSITSVHPSCDWTLLPGCFAQSSKPKGRKNLQMSLNASSKEAFNAIHKEVKEALRPSLDDTDEPESSPAVNALSSRIQRLIKDREKFHEYFYLIQQSLAVVQVMKHSRNTHLDQLQSVEKMLLHSLDDSLTEVSPLQQIFQLVKTRQRKQLKIEDILTVAIYLSSLGGGAVVPEDSEYNFTNTFSQAFVEDRLKDSDVLARIFGGCDVDEVSALKTADRLWRRLQSITKTRNHLKNYRNLYGRNSDMEPNKFRSLLSQMVDDCLTPPEEAVSDLEYKSAGFKDIIKTGFSLFVNVSKPRPKDAALIMVYVLGGITPSEIHEIQSMVQKARPSCGVLVGSSHLTYPMDIVERCFTERFP